MKKKLLTTLLLVILVFNFIFTSCVFADADDITSSLPESNGEGQLSTSQVQTVIDTGGGSQGPTQTTTSVLPSLFQIISLMLNSFPMAVNAVMTHMTRNPSGITDDPLKAAIQYAVDLLDVSQFFSIKRTVFNEVALFNADVFNMTSSYKVGIGSSEKTIYQVSAILKLKESTAKWFYTCRLLAMMINLCILIYIGIRMAISTVASEEARYKKMLMSWAESMVLLFFIHYIMLFAISLGNSVINIIYDLREGMTVISFEEFIMKKIFTIFATGAGMKIFMYSLFFWFMVLMQAKFFLTYMKRLLSMMFLTIIAPFITVTYPIDKMGDGKAQAFEFWIKEYIINIAIQPIHAAIYLVFVFTAGAIAEQAPLVGMIFLLALGRIEKIVRNIFGITDSVSMKNFDDELKKGPGGGGKGGKK